MAEYEGQRLSNHSAEVVDAARTAVAASGQGRKPTSVSIKVDGDEGGGSTSVLRMDTSATGLARSTPQAHHHRSAKRSASGFEGDLASTKFEFNVFKGEITDRLAQMDDKLKRHESHHELAGSEREQLKANREDDFKRHDEHTASISEAEKRTRSLLYSQGQELQASIQEQAAYIAQVQERFEDELRQKMDKSLGQLRQVQDMVYKMESLEERMNSLEGQFRERVNTLAQMHGARLERVEGTEISPVSTIDEQGLRDAMDRKLAVVEKQRMDVLKRLEDLELSVQTQRPAVPRQTWHKVEQEGYSSLSAIEKTPEELSRLTSDAEDDPQASLNLIEPLPHDSWGATVLLICKELPDLCSKEGDRLSCIMMVALPCICCLTVFLQFVLIQLLNTYIIGPAIEDVHQAYCVSRDAPITSTWFTCVALWIWMMQLINEVRNCIALSTVVYKCPHVRTRGEMALVRYINENAKQDDYHGDVNGVRIAGLTRYARVILLVTLTLPRIYLAMWIGWIGSIWLAASLHYSDFLLHTVGLQLILHIDTAVYSSCVPDSYREKIKKSSIERPHSEGETIVTASRESMLKKMLATIVLVCLCIAYVMVFRVYFVHQHVSPSSCS